MHTKRDCFVFAGYDTVEHVLSAGGRPLEKKKDKQNGRLRSD